MLGDFLKRFAQRVLRSFHAGKQSRRVEPQIRPDRRRRHCAQLTADSRLDLLDARSSRLRTKKFDDSVAYHSGAFLIGKARSGHWVEVDGYSVSRILDVSTSFGKL